jgi:glycosyltransferase involved in cell wall biosynthesis
MLARRTGSLGGSALPKMFPYRFGDMYNQIVSFVVGILAARVIGASDYGVTDIARTILEILAIVHLDQSGVAAMAFGFGLPMIATRVGAVPDTVRNEHNGLLIPLGDVNVLTEAMARFIASENLREQLAYGARGSAAKELSWDSIAQETLTVYESAIRAHD